MFFEPARGHGLPHDPFKALVAPRPIGWISTRAADGRLNLAPYSFFNAVSSRPPIVMFSSEGDKDSIAFARESGEFVVNIVGRAQFDAMNASSADAPRGVSEFALAGLDAAPSRVVAAPRVAGAPASLECRVTEILVPKDAAGRPTGVFVAFGEVVGIHIDDQFVIDGRFDIVRAGLIARLGYMDYAPIASVFARERPKYRGQE
ncbi:MAG: flavin reductase family protein [Rhizobiaceae bacterium]